MRRPLLPLLLLLAAGAIRAGEPPLLDQAVTRGLAALVRMQSADGQIGEGAGITALAGMALLAGGHTPVRGEHAPACLKSLRYVMSRQDPATGYLGNDFGNMYGHGFAALFLAECYGMAPAEPIRRALEAAIDLIHRSQNAEGGWRYQPVPVDADISVTICQVMALRAAWNVGIGGKASVDASARAIAYVRRCATGTGAFSYTATSAGSWGMEGAEGLPRAAAGAMSLIGAGITDLADPHLGPALRFIRRNVPAHLRTESNFWYGQYYAAQAMFHSPERADWNAYWEQAMPAILGKQGADGAWPGHEASRAYGTAMALIILQIPNQYLPIFQR